MSGTPAFSRSRAESGYVPRARRTGWGRLLAWHPPRGLGLLLLAGFYGSTAYYGAQLGGQWTDLVAHYGTPTDMAANLTGFGIQTVQISGQHALTDDEILNAAGVDGTTSLPTLDVEASREGLEKLPLVRSASVRKLYPGTLSVQVDERQPYAIWQHDNAFDVISADGTAIGPYDDPRFAQLPIVVGPGANLRATEIVALLDAAPDLKARVKGATLVADRRWNLTFDNQVLVRLPEADPASALRRLAELEDQQKVLEKDVLAIDLRLPDRVALRLSEEAAAARAAMLAKRPKKGAET